LFWIASDPDVVLETLKQGFEEDRVLFFEASGSWREMGQNSMFRMRQSKQITEHDTSGRCANE
jgi:hypothetical protein